jgi:hypothetical protein
VPDGEAFWSRDGGEEHRLSVGHLADGDYDPRVFRWLYRPRVMTRPVTRRERKSAVLGCLAGFVRRFGRGTLANLTVLPAGGTLLGVERNGRMIPWDSDIDLLLRMWEYPRLREVMLPHRGRLRSGDCVFVDHASMLSPLARGWIPRIPARIYALSTGHFIDIFGLQGNSAADDEFTHLLSRDTITRHELGPLRPCTFEGIALECYSRGTLSILAAEGLCKGNGPNDCDHVLTPNHRWDPERRDFVETET